MIIIIKETRQLNIYVYMEMIVVKFWYFCVMRTFTKVCIHFKLSVVVFFINYSKGNIAFYNDHIF